MHKVNIYIPTDKKGFDFPFCCYVEHSDQKQLSGGGEGLIWIPCASPSLRDIVLRTIAWI